MSDAMNDYNFATRSIHAGQKPDAETGAVSVPIYQTSTFVQQPDGPPRSYEYARGDNPTRTALETALASLDNGRYGLAFASGMAAETAVLLLLSPGDHVICGNDVYGGTYTLLQHMFVERGLVVDFVDTREPANVQAALRPTTRLIWLETPSNPLLKLADIATIARSGREQGILTVVDNTFASPYFQQPLALGADIVLYSTTKYLGGHHDVKGGALVLNDTALYERLTFVQNTVGGVPGPFDCWLVLRGIKTLALRMQAHAANAGQIARWLVEHPAAAEVIYPGLPTHPQHALAQRQMSGFSGIISLRLKGGVSAAQDLVRRTRLFTLAVSLGGVESLIEIPATMTHTDTADSTIAVPPDLLRLSIGIEDIEDLIADLQAALR